MSQALAPRDIEIEPAGAVTPYSLLDRAVASGASVETLTRLMELQERHERNQARKAFDEAMAAAKGEIGPIKKNREVDFTSAKGRTNYRHEDLAEVARTIDPVLRQHGLSYRFRTSSAIGEPVSVTCIVSHRLGHSEENTLQAGRDESGNKNSIQAVGSTITYLQRYALKAALGLAASNDDDGRPSDTRDNEPISSEQVAKIQALAEETKTSIPKLCALLKVESVPELTVVAYNRALEILESRKGGK